MLRNIALSNIFYILISLHCSLIDMKFSHTKNAQLFHWNHIFWPVNNFLRKTSQRSIKSLSLNGGKVLLVAKMAIKLLRVGKLPMSTTTECLHGARGAKLGSLEILKYFLVNLKKIPKCPPPCIFFRDNS